MGSFIVRVIGYSLLLIGSGRTADHLWLAHGLDQYFALQPLHDAAVRAVIGGIVVCSIFGFGWLRGPAIFVAFLIAGAVLTAPFAFAHALGA